MPLSVGKRKYAAKTAVMGDHWAEMKDVMKRHWPAAMNALAKEAGKTKVKDTRVRAYSAGIDAVTADDFEARVRGKETKWYDNYVAKMFE